MVIDTSALLAILQREAERRSLIEAIESADVSRLPVASFVEISIVIESRYGAEGLRDLDRFLSRARIELIPVDHEQGQLARSALAASARDVIAQDSIMAIASPMRPRSAWASLCCARATISFTRTCRSSKLGVAIEP